MAEINAGLGSLKQLKAFILAESMRAATDYDAQLTAIGLSVAARFEQECMRVWAYDAAVITQAPANRSQIISERYPINLTVPLKIELCSAWVNNAPAWVELPGAIINVTEAGGIVQLGGFQGNYLARIRLTCAGGFWWLGLDANTVAPTGAALVPADLVGAWLMQCQALWLVRDNLGISVAGSGSVSFVTLTLPGYELIPDVVAALKQFIRYQIAG